MSENQILRSKSDIDAEQSYLLPKLHYFSRCYEFRYSQGMKTQISFQNFNEKKEKESFWVHFDEKL